MIDTTHVFRFVWYLKRNLRGVFLEEHVELRHADVTVSSSEIVWDVETKGAKLPSFTDNSIEHEE